MTQQTVSATEAAVRQLVADVDAYQSDTERFTSLLTEDVVIVNLAGRRVQGREAMRMAMEEGLRTSLAKVFTQVEILDIAFLRPDLAIVSCLKSIRDENPETTLELPAAGSLTYVVVDEGDAWRIALAQTTPRLM